MNSYQIIATISLCMLVFSGVVGALVLLGIPLLAAFVLVYLATVWYMAGMQRRAREWADSNQQYGKRHRDPVRNISEQRVLRVVGTNHSLKP